MLLDFIHLVHLQWMVLRELFYMFRLAPRIHIPLLLMGQLLYLLQQQHYKIIIFNILEIIKVEDNHGVKSMNS